ncbi:MAG TPA: PTS sugar transporter subunit IIB [Candidatus Bathyarchaeia archaeon]|nr:PTS sugar transporter subunit IIB [Candidatus Bathyarchaeia archaeon]
MKRIILACSAGMSTSIVVSKMKEEAKKRGEAYEIYAIPGETIEEELQQHGSDVVAILLGPQVRFMKAEAESQAKPYGIPVDVMDTLLYGTANGAKILDHALQIAKK